MVGFLIKKKNSFFELVRNFLTKKNEDEIKNNVQKTSNKKFDNAFIDSIKSETYSLAINLLKEGYVPNKIAQKSIDNLYLRIYWSYMQNKLLEPLTNNKEQINNIAELFTFAKPNIDFDCVFLDENLNIVSLSSSSSLMSGLSSIMDLPSFGLYRRRGHEYIKDYIKNMEKCNNNFFNVLISDSNFNVENYEKTLELVKEYDLNTYLQVDSYKQNLYVKKLEDIYAPYAAFLLLRTSQKENFDLKKFKKILEKSYDEKKVGEMIYKVLFIDEFYKLKENRPTDYVNYIQKYSGTSDFSISTIHMLFAKLDIQEYAKNIHMDFFKNCHNFDEAPKNIQLSLKSEYDYQRNIHEEYIINSFRCQKLNNDRLSFKKEGLNSLLKLLKLDNTEIQNDLNDIQEILTDLNNKKLVQEVQNFVFNVNQNIGQQLADVYQLSLLDKTIDAKGIISGFVETILETLKDVHLKTLEEQINDLKKPKPVKDNRYKVK